MTYNYSFCCLAEQNVLEERDWGKKEACVVRIYSSALPLLQDPPPVMLLGHHSVIAYMDLSPLFLSLAHNWMKAHSLTFALSFLGRSLYIYLKQLLSLVKIIYALFQPFTLCAGGEGPSHSSDGQDSGERGRGFQQPGWTESIMAPWLAELLDYWETLSMSQGPKCKASWPAPASSWSLLKDRISAVPDLTSVSHTEVEE